MRSFFVLSDDLYMCSLPWSASAKHGTARVDTARFRTTRSHAVVFRIAEFHNASNPIGQAPVTCAARAQFTGMVTIPCLKRSITKGTVTKCDVANAVKTRRAWQGFTLLETLVALVLLQLTALLVLHSQLQIRQQLTKATNYVLANAWLADISAAQQASALARHNQCAPCVAGYSPIQVQQQALAQLTAPYLPYQRLFQARFCQQGTVLQGRLQLSWRSVATDTLPVNGNGGCAANPGESLQGLEFR